MDTIEPLAGADLGDLAISFNPQTGVADIAPRDEGRKARVRARLREFGFVGGEKIDSKIDIEPRLKFSALQLCNRLLEELAIQIKTDRHDVAALGGAQNAARSADFQIAHGDAKAGTEGAVLFDRVDSFARGTDRHHLARQQEISVGFVFGATNPTAKLVKIGQTEPVGAVDDDRVRVWNIEAALDDGGANGYVDFSGDETCHHFLKLIRIHLAMADLDPRLRHKIDNLLADPLDRLDAVVQKINLALTFDLAINRVSNDSFVVTADDCFHRQAVQRRRFDRRHVLHADEREIKRTRDWRGRKREHVHEFEQLLEFFFV